MADPGAGEKLKVFISYSRKDSATFADELVQGSRLLSTSRRFSTVTISPLARTGRCASAA